MTPGRSGTSAMMRSHNASTTSPVAGATPALNPFGTCMAKPTTGPPGAFVAHQ